MSTRKMMAQVRKLLSGKDWLTVQQGIVLAAGLADPDVIAIMTKGVVLADDGELKWNRDSEVVKRVPAALRPQAALDIAARFGLLKDKPSLYFSRPNSDATLLDLSCLEGCTIAHIDVSQIGFKVDDKDGAPLALAPFAGNKTLVKLNVSSSGWRRSSGTLDLSPLQGCTNLTSLILSRRSPASLAPLSALRNLKRLGLNSTNTTDLTPLAGLKNLEELSLNYCPLKDLGPLSGLKNLRKLVLPDHGDGIDQSPLYGLTGLAHGWQTGDPHRLWTSLVAAPELFADVKKISLASKFVFADGSTTDGNAALPPSLAPLEKLPWLEHLAVCGSRVTATDLAPLATLKNLKTLVLRGSKDPRYPFLSMDVLGSFQGLTSLTIQGGPFLRKDHLASIGACRSLRSLSIENQSIDNLSFLSELTELSSLHIKNCKPTASGVWDFTVLTKLPELRKMAKVFQDGTLKVSGWTAYLWLWSMRGEDLSGLKKLNLDGVKHGASLLPLRGCSNLEVLSLSESGFSDITDLEALNHLEKITLSGTLLDDVSALIPLPKLAYIDLSASNVATRPSRVVLDNRDDVSAYQKTLARVLSRKEAPSEAEQRWMSFMEASAAKKKRPKSKSTRKVLAQVRKLLSSKEWSSVKQGIVLAAGLAEPEVTATMTRGVIVEEDGELKWHRDSEVVKRVPAALRPQAALDIAARFGLFKDKSKLYLSSSDSDAKLVDLSCLEGSTLTNINLSKIGVKIDDKEGSSLALAAFAGNTNLVALSIASRGWRRTSGTVDLTPLRGCTNLVVLSLSRRTLASVDSLSALRKLKKLTLNSTTITDLTPLSGLVELEVLALDDCAVTDLRPLSGLKRLCSLKLPNKGDGIDQTPLYGLTGLVRGSVPADDGSNEVPEARILALKNGDPHPLWTAIVAAPELFADIKELKLSAKYSGAEPPSLAPLEKLPWLEHLSLRSRRSGVTDLAPLGSLKNLKSLVLEGSTHGSKYPFTSLGVLGSLPQLTSLTMKGRIMMPVDGLKPLSKCGSLTSLTLTNQRIDDLDFLSALTTLESLRITDCKPGSNGWDFSVLTKLTGLRKMGTVSSDGHLNLVDWSAYVWLWSMVGEDLSGLKKLKLDGLKYGSSLLPLQGCTNLEHLSLSQSGFDDVSDLASLTKLTKINLSGTLLNDVSALIPLSKLAHLDLSTSNVATRPSRVVLDNRDDVAAYQKTLARVLSRKETRSEQENLWIASLSI